MRSIFFKYHLNIVFLIMCKVPDYFIIISEDISKLYIEFYECKVPLIQSWP